jgi:hypothetical protein
MGTVELSGLCLPCQGCTFHFWSCNTQRGVSVLPCDMVLVIVIVWSCTIVCYLWRHSYCVLYVSFYVMCSLWFYFPHMLILGNIKSVVCLQCDTVLQDCTTMCYCVTGLYYNVPLCYRTILWSTTMLQDCTTIWHSVTGLYYNVPLCYRTVLQCATLLQDCTTIWHSVTGL